ncbi:MAG TPA: hypothetical protein VFZ14_11415 [Burkholderiales bacterium]|nr:hypothetical protein [Burkholderiales bacterium]
MVPATVLHAFLRCAALLVAMPLGGCFHAQVFPSQHENLISLHKGDLEAAGVAFITPSAATGQEEEKQAVALTFADVLKAERPKIRVVSLAQALGAINKAGLSEAYRRMYDDYRYTGLFDRDMLRKVGELTGARYIAQLKLQRFGQGEKERFGALGFRIIETRYASIRLFFQIWDSNDGTIAWEGMQETHYAEDTFREKAVSLRTLVERTAHDLIARLP